MDEVKVVINNEEYTESQFEKDIVRMFDSYRNDHMGSMNCDGVCCDDCPLYKVSCNMKTTNSFKTIGIVYEWALEHPVITNKDMLIKTFGKDVIHYIETRPYKEKWLDEEYKEPTKEEND